MSKEPTIIFEITPQEAMILREMLGTYCWTKGPYGQKVREMYLALDEVYDSFQHAKTVGTVTEFGFLSCNAIWLDDQ